jgi:hypothetical protein
MVESQSARRCPAREALAESSVAIVNKIAVPNLAISLASIAAKAVSAAQLE